jgi:hypothetical protein
MTAFVALLRAVNVGGTGKLPMIEFVRMCEAAGFISVRTYIASGNAVFSSRATEARVKAASETPCSLTRENRLACSCAPPPRWTRCLPEILFRRLLRNGPLRFFSMDRRPAIR